MPDVMENALVDAEYSQSGDHEGDDSTQIGCCNPATRCHRMLALIPMCLLAFGSYYCYDSPAALETHILSDMGVSEAQYSNLYAWYSYPNIVLCFVGGFLLDSVFGVRLGSVIFSVIICVGHAVFAGAALIDQFWLMVVGRFLFGLGGESLAVAQNSYAVRWFRGKELNTVFGVQLSVARLGSMANFNSLSHVYHYVENTFKGHTALGITLMIAGLFCLFSVLCALVLAVLDKRAEHVLNQSSENAERVNLRDVLSFGPLFWGLCVVCVTYYVAIFPFISFANGYLQQKYNMTEAEANFATGVPYTVSAFVSPLCGLLCDVAGINLFWTLFAVLLSGCCHLAFCLSSHVIPPLVIMVFLGLMFSLMACAFWPMVALIIPEHQLSTAYGVMQALQNLGLAVVSQLTGFIANRYGNDAMEWFFTGWITLSIVSCVVLNIYNEIKGGALNPRLYRRFRPFRQSTEPLVEAES